MDNNSVIFTGDLMLGEWHFSRGFGIHKALKRYGGGSFFAEITQYLNPVEIVAGNLECALAPAKTARKFPMLADEALLPSLKKAGFTAFSVANNHIVDYGKERALYTFSKLREYEFDILGLSDYPIVTQFFGGHCADIIAADVLPFHHKRPPYKDNSLILTGEMKDVFPIMEKFLKESDSDFRFVYLHWGEEFVEFPCRTQVHWARKLIDSGADAVIGSHPHIMQGIERYQKKTIAYSLGNLVSDMAYPPTKTGYMLQLILDEKENALNANPIFYEIEDDYVPVPSSEAQKMMFLREMNDYLTPYITGKTPASQEIDERYTKNARTAENELWEWVKIYYRQNFLRYPLSAQWGWMKEKLKIGKKR